MQIQRFELKVPLRGARKGEVLDALLPYLRPDPQAGGFYTVRSIYFDSPTLRFYHEKLDGRGVRRKLRLRTYAGPGATERGYLEIKRKFGRTVLKERVAVELREVDGALNGKAEAILRNRSYRERRTLHRFRSGIQTLELEPTALIVYEREAWIGREDPRLRVTFDAALRSSLHPHLDALCRQSDLRHFLDGFVLELKFDVRPPKWLARSMTHLRLRPVPYSKYCQGIDAWTKSSAP